MTCPLDCPDACGVIVETDEKEAFVGLRGNPDHPWSRGSLCGKTAIYGEIVTSEERLMRPLVRGKSGELEEASWERALAEIARRVAPLRPGETLALWYAGCMGQIARRYPITRDECARRGRGPTGGSATTRRPRAGAASWAG